MSHLTEDMQTSGVGARLGTQAVGLRAMLLTSVAQNQRAGRPGLSGGPVSIPPGAILPRPFSAW